MQNGGMENRQKLSVNDAHIKVLVVDDHPNTAKMLARAISRLGPNVEVISATSGYEALKYSDNGAADILITDMMMPEMTGLELIEALNDQPSRSPAVSFILTAHDSTALRDLAQRIHVKQVIAKPVHPEWICQLILQTVGELKQKQSVSAEPVSQQTQPMHPGQQQGYEVLNLNQLLWEVAKKFQSQAEVKNQLLVVGKTAPYPRIWGNMAQLRQAFRGLVWRAINDTPRGGTVILSSEHDPKMVKITVRETGHDALTANSSNESQQNDGNADGEDRSLTIVKSIIEEHGGFLSIESEPGNGSCFVVQFPIYLMSGPGEASSNDDDLVSNSVRR